MTLKLKHLTVDGIHKVLVLDEERSSLEGKLLYIGEGSTQSVALLDAMEYCEQAYRSNSELIWN